MVRGIYTAATGAIVAENNIDMIANNLANVSTIGFKRQMMQIESQPMADVYRWQSDPGPAVATQGQLSSTSSQAYVGQLGSGADVYDTPTNFEQGSIELTGNQLDFALYGKGFFAIRNALGIRYTRDGSFVRNPQNYLTTTNGDAVLDTQGNLITLPAQGQISCDQAGTLSVNGAIFAKIGIYDVQNPRVVRSSGGNLLVDSGSNVTPDTTTAVIQGGNEKSNADVVRSMVDLIVAQRWFDANSKVIQTEDQATGLAISAVGNTTTTGG